MLFRSATNANGLWTLAMGDRVFTDVGTLTNWSISIDYTTPGSGGAPVLTYAWSPLAGLYTNTIATTAYTGTNLSTVYAAPTVQTTYTVTATDVVTGFERHLRTDTAFEHHLIALSCSTNACEDVMTYRPIRRRVSRSLWIGTRVSGLCPGCGTESATKYQ